jgi:hypothetical protein
LDRAVLLFIWNGPGIKYKKWLFNEVEMGKSIVRVLGGLIVVLFCLLLFVLGL